MKRYGPFYLLLFSTLLLFSISAQAQTNMALYKVITVSSEESTARAKKFINDSDLNTRWGSAFAEPQWVVVDLGSPQTIGRVKLTWEAAYAVQYTVQVSNDNTTWSDVYTQLGGDGGIDEISLAATARYVRLYFIKRRHPYGFSLWEFEIYREGSVTVPTSSATSSAASSAVSSIVATTTSSKASSVTSSSASSTLISNVKTQILPDGKIASYVLEWTRPNKRENGVELLPVEIGGYEIRGRNADRKVTYETRNVSGMATSYADLISLTADVRTLEIAVYDVNGLYSQFVPIEPPVTAPVKKPAMPVNLKIIKK